MKPSSRRSGCSGADSLNLSVTRYKGGVTSYLEVITAQSAALTDEITAVNILGRRMGEHSPADSGPRGGWDRSSLPERPECCGKLESGNSKDALAIRILERGRVLGARVRAKAKDDLRYDHYRLWLMSSEGQGELVARVNQEHGISAFAESIARILVVTARKLLIL